MFSSRKDGKELNFKSSKNSNTIKEVNTSRNALTFYTQADPETCLASLRVLDPAKCAELVRSGMQNDIEHSQWHLGHKDFETCHAHLLKGSNYFEDFTVAEVICMLKNVKQFEKEHHLCKDGKTHCMLSQEDADKLITAYTEYYTQKNPADHKVMRHTPESSLTYEAVKEGLTAYRFVLQTFAYIFLTTFLDKYIRPLLINQGFSLKQAYRITEVAKSGCRLMSTTSILSTTVDLVIRQGLKWMLDKMGAEPKFIDSLNSALTKINIIAEFSSDPFSLMKLYNVSVMTLAAERSAYLLIHCLPKLREEPSPVNKTVEMQPVQSSAHRRKF
jgi:hypothetical protein